MKSIPQEKGSGYLKQLQAKMKTAFDPTGKKASEVEFYFGPNDFQILKNTEKESTFGKDVYKRQGQHHHQRSLLHSIQRDRQVCNHDRCG